MFKVTKKEIQWGGRTLTMETGKIARQAGGAVKISYGDTVLLCTAVAQKTPKTGIDFFPLTVNYVEKTYAAGKIPGGFFKREGRPSEKETLTSRLIDRPIRPLFPAGFYNETQVICTLISHDLENDPDIVALVGASAALTISGVPFMGPIGGARVGYIDGDYVINPTFSEMEDSDLDLIVSATKDSVMMVESEAKELSEEVMLGAVKFGHDEMQPVIDMIIELAEECAKEPWVIEKKELDSKLQDGIRKLAADKFSEAYGLTDKQERSTRLAEIRDEVKAEFVTEENAGDSVAIGKFVKSLESDVVRGDLIKTKKRIDGRGPADVRDIASEVDLLPKTHGSALFTRGETQALVTATLGTGQDEQLVDSVEGEYRQNFMLHYNFPPFSVGEAGFLKSPGRREIGHGKLAFRAINPMMPSKDEFPYTVRMVSEITESNGSSSMATVCGTSLAMMDAGVPLKAPVAGIAMGLVKEGDDFVVLSDILGDEDHLGDMDFKVAGTNDGVTALQMDIKVAGITQEIMQIALDQAGEGRKYILAEMSKAMTTARDEVNGNAPRITTIKIDPEKIREVIGTGGKVIREITETTGAKIDIEEDGTIRVAAVDGDAGQAAVDWINGIVQEPEAGEIYTGKVVRIVDFGAFVNFMGSKDGLVHISEINDDRVESVADVISEGDEVKVKCIEIDGRGKVRLSMRLVDQESGADLSDEKEPPKAAPSGKRDSGPRRRKEAS
ncbi:MAG: polyribonucleotide nucleotidyltransferase [Rickettsiales bacterium]|nr:polyribonucleotide nucleotidyltransferase [Rickettsiales bacterium]